MSSKILVTDNLFIFDEHVKQLEEAGFEVERLDKPEASERELIQAVKGKVGYILGGIEKVTEPVIAAGDSLKAIAFTGADWAGFIPAHEAAIKQGIAIANTPGANTYAVAEYTLTLMLMMLRHILELGKTGDKSFMTAQSLRDVQIGIVGMGRIGERVTRMIKDLSGTQVYYWNRTRKPELEAELGIIYKELPDLIASCDVISNHVSSRAREIFTTDLLQKAKNGILIINAGSEKAFNTEALYNLITTKNARAAFDYPVEDERFKGLPLSSWFSSNSSTAYNTVAANKQASDMATQSIINLLTTGIDKYKVN